MRRRQKFRCATPVRYAERDQGSGIDSESTGTIGTAVRAPEKDADAFFGRTTEPTDEAAVVGRERATGSYQ